MFAAGDDFAAADTVRLVYTRRDQGDGRGAPARRRPLPAASASGSSSRTGRSRPTAARSPAARRGDGRAAGKVAVVTGAAQGFGLEIAQDLAAGGRARGRWPTSTPRARARRPRAIAAARRGRAIGLPINVTSGASVAEAIHQVVRSFGGFDLFVSNAGVLKAGSVKTQPREGLRLRHRGQLQGLLRLRAEGRADPGRPAPGQARRTGATSSRSTPSPAS